MIRVERGIGISIKGTTTEILNDICNVIVKTAENYSAATNEGKEKILRDLLTPIYQAASEALGIDKNDAVVLLSLTKQETTTVREALKCYMDAQVLSRDEDGTVITKHTEDSDPWHEAFSIGYRIQNLWEDKENVGD